MSGALGSEVIRPGSPVVFTRNEGPKYQMLECRQSGAEDRLQSIILVRPRDMAPIQGHWSGAIVDSPELDPYVHLALISKILTEAYMIRLIV